MLKQYIKEAESKFVIYWKVHETLVQGMIKLQVLQGYDLIADTSQMKTITFRKFINLYHLPNNSS